MLEYKIVEKGQFTVIGKIRNFDADDVSINEINKFWHEHMQTGKNKTVYVMFGIPMNLNGKKELTFYCLSNIMNLKNT